jgi:hypothetical protein
VAEVAAGIQAIAHALLKDLDVGKAAISLALPDRQAVTGDFEDTTGLGASATSPRSVPKVEGSSCAIQAARSSQWHWVQYAMTMRGGLASENLIETELNRLPRTLVISDLRAFPIRL